MTAVIPKVSYPPRTKAGKRQPNGFLDLDNQVVHKWYGAQRRHKRKVDEEIFKAWMHELDYESTVHWVTDPTDAPTTACWSIGSDGKIHRIKMNPFLTRYIDNETKLYGKRAWSRREWQYLLRVLWHEIGHGRYTERDMAKTNAMIKRWEINFPTVNLFEDGSMENKARLERPSNFPSSFGWAEWHDPFRWIGEGFDARNVFLALIKAEKKRKIEPLVVAKANKEMEHPMPRYAGKMGERVLWYFRQVAGKGATKRYPNTLDMFPLIKRFMEEFDIPKDDGGGGDGDGEGGDGEEGEGKSKPPSPVSGPHGGDVCEAIDENDSANGGSGYGEGKGDGDGASEDEAFDKGPDLSGQEIEKKDFLGKYDPPSDFFGSGWRNK
jgi:hypothetical protein